MKFKNILTGILSAVLALGAASCTQKEFAEVTEMNLARCLEPQNLAARVNSATGDEVTFSWDVNKDADAYDLVLYTDEEMKAKDRTLNVLPGQVPYTIRLTADQKYWFTVQAYRFGSDEARDESTLSNVAVFDGSVKTYAVKDNLFPQVTDRTTTSISLKWKNDLSDYVEVTNITAAPVKGGKTVKKELSSAEAAAAAATIDGLVPATEYQVTVFYMSASRGALDVWTKSEQGAATVINSSDELKAAVAAGGTYFIPYSDTPYSMGTAKPAQSLTLIGELAPDGTKPTVVGKIELTDALASGSDLHFESIKFDGGATSRIVEHTGGEPVVGTVEFVNCEITGYTAGLFYGNNNNVVKIGTIKFDTCDIYGILGSGGDAFDIRKTTEIDNVVFLNNTIYDGIRTMFRIDASDAIKIGTIDFENNTVKNIATMDDGNNRGFFAVRVPHNMTLKNNLFLYEDGGKGEDSSDADKAQLFQDNANTVVPTLTASGNYSFAHGKSFFSKVSAQEAGFTVMNVDPCFNSKGNFFQLAADDLIDKQVGASKWWIPYEEDVEDLTQHVISGAHTWNLQDAKLFAGEVKNSRVRDELLLVGTEATPINADGGINFLSAAPLNRKGIPTEGYAAFLVDAPGSVDLLVSDTEKRGGSLVVAISDDNGLRVVGGAVASESNGEVQKVVVKEVSGEGTIYLYPTGPISLVKLAWSEDVLAGSKVLPAPEVKAEPVTLTEGDETAVTITWDEIPNAAEYVVVFNKRANDPQTECSFTIPAEDIAALKAGLYTFSVTAYPAEDDIYYQKSEAGIASIAIQPKGGAGEMVTVEKVWDFSQADWQEQFAKYGAANSDITNWNLTYDDLTIFSGSKSKYNTTYFQFGGKSGEMDRYFKLTAPEQGTLRITVSNTGSSEALDRTVAVTVGGDTQTQPGGAPSTAPAVLEFSIMAGEVVITAPVNGLRFYKIEYTYTTGGASKVEYDWDFSGADWQAEFAKLGAVNTDITNWDLTVDGLLFHSGSKSKYNTTYIQFGGKSGEMDRYFKFTAPEQGTVTVTVSNTGSSAAMDRTVAVTVGSDTQAQPAGFGKATPGTLEYSVMAGEVIITAPENGLCFYKIHYNN